MTTFYHANDEYVQRLNAALSLMETDYAQDLKLEDMAAAAHFSPFHFHRIFSALLGEPPGAYLRRIRLEKAAHLLYLHPEYTVTRVAMQTGFSSSAVFARAFQGHFGVSAHDFRKKVLPNKFQDWLAQYADQHPALGGELKYPLQGFLDLPRTRLAYVRSMHGYGPGIGKAWHQLFAWAYPRGLIQPGTRLLGLPLDDPDVTPLNKCRYFVSITVGNEISPSGPVSIMTLEPGRYAMFAFEGRSEESPDLYKQVYGLWLPNSGYLPDDRPTLEAYTVEAGQQDADSTNGQRKFSLLLPIRPL